MPCRRLGQSPWEITTWHDFSNMNCSHTSNLKISDNTNNPVEDSFGLCLSGYVIARSVDKNNIRSQLNHSVIHCSGINSNRLTISFQKNLCIDHPEETSGLFWVHEGHYCSFHAASSCSCYHTLLFSLIFWMNIITKIFALNLFRWALGETCN